MRSPDRFICILEKRETLGCGMAYMTVRLADSRIAKLDWLKENELPEVTEALNSVIREGKYLFMNSEITDMEEERRWFEHGTKEGMRYLVARVDGRAVGGASIHPHTDKRAHVADYGIYIREGYRNLGLGTALTKELIEIAKKQGLEILQLSVYATNERAFHVYKKCGYRECGRLTRDIRFLDGTYTDRILMEIPLRGPNTPQAHP
jgi:RimJ/RimL family protein N-acetyltransferase